MKQSELTISFNREKLAALIRYMGKKDLSLEAELNDAVQKLYEKFVPTPVREYIEESESLPPKVRQPRQRREGKGENGASRIQPEVSE